MRSNRRFGKYFSKSISPGRPHQAERWPSWLRCSNGHVAYNIFVRVKFERVCLRSFFFGQVFPLFWVLSTLSSWHWRTRGNLNRSPSRVIAHFWIIRKTNNFETLTFRGGTQTSITLEKGISIISIAKKSTEPTIKGETISRRAVLQGISLAGLAIPLMQFLTPSERKAQAADQKPGTVTEEAKMADQVAKKPVVIILDMAKGYGWE